MRSSDLRPINRSVPCSRCSGSTLKYGDCRSCTSSASFSVSSNTCSPVLLVKSASTTVSRSAKARVRFDE
jgi:DnaJ-class molecular chaperone